MPALRRLAAPALVVALAAAWLGPLLSVAAVPSVDGPAYVFLGVALRELLVDPATPLAGALEVFWAPTPFWTAPAAIALLTAVLDGDTAEKTLYVLELLLMVFALARLRRAVHGAPGTVALLGFPLGAHLLFRAGFHGFALGVPVALLALAHFWAHRRRPEVGWTAGLAALVALAWFTHLFVWAAAIVTIAGCAILLRDSPRRTLAAIAVALGLCVPLVLLDSTPKGNGKLFGPKPFTWERARLAIAGETLSGLGPAERPAARAVVATLALLALASLRRRSEEEAGGRRDHRVLLAAAAGAALVLVAVPRGVGPGTILEPRFALFALLFLAAGVLEPRSPWIRGGLVGGVALLGAHQLLIAPPLYAIAADRVEAFLAPLSGLRPGERLVVQRAPSTRTEGFRLHNADATRHAASRRAAEVLAVDLSAHFVHHRATPVRLTAAMRARPPHLAARAASVRSGLALAEVRGWADVVYLWGFAPREVAALRAGTGFVRRSASGRGVLLAADRRPPARKPTAPAP